MITERNDEIHGNWFSCDNGTIELQLTVKNEEAREKFVEFWNTVYEDNKHGNYRNGIYKKYNDDNFEAVMCSTNAIYLSHFILSLVAISKEINSNDGIPVFTW